MGSPELALLKGGGLPIGRSREPRCRGTEPALLSQRQAAAHIGLTGSIIEIAAAGEGFER